MQDMKNPESEMQGTEEAPLAEVALCVYKGGTLALKLDGGEKVPVESLDQALQAIGQIASEAAGTEKNPDTAGAGEEELMGEDEEKAFTSGFKGSSGY